MLEPADDPAMPIPAAMVIEAVLNPLVKVKEDILPASAGGARPELGRPYPEGNAVNFPNPFKRLMAPPQNIQEFCDGAFPETWNDVAALLKCLFIRSMDQPHPKSKLPKKVLFAAVAAPGK